MVSKRDRRKSGYVTPTPTVSKKDLIKYDLFVNTFYDDWEDIRDGMRDRFRDNKLIKKIYWQRSSSCTLVQKRIRMNEKQKRLLKKRRAMKCRG